MSGGHLFLRPCHYFYAARAAYYLTTTKLPLGFFSCNLLLASYPFDCSFYAAHAVQYLTTTRFLLSQLPLDCNFYAECAAQYLTTISLS